MKSMQDGLLFSCWLHYFGLSLTPPEYRLAFDARLAIDQESLRSAVSEARACDELETEHGISQVAYHWIPMP